MSLVSALVVFVIMWWTVLFAVLPFGVRPPEQPAPGHAASAPERPKILKKMMWTTAVTIVLWIGVYGLITSDLISFRVNN